MNRRLDAYKNTALILFRLYQGYKHLHDPNYPNERKKDFYKIFDEFFEDACQNKIFLSENIKIEIENYLDNITKIRQSANTIEEITSKIKEFHEENESKLIEKIRREILEIENIDFKKY